MFKLTTTKFSKKEHVQCING